jgi:sulfur carrier protein ThiS
MDRRGPTVGHPGEGEEERMQQAIAVRVTSFGEGRQVVRLPRREATVGMALQEAGVEPTGRRVALNGHPVSTGVGVLEDDELTVVPRVQGG